MEVAFGTTLDRQKVTTHFYFKQSISIKKRQSAVHKLSPPTVYAQMILRGLFHYIYNGKRSHIFW